MAGCNEVTRIIYEFPGYKSINLSPGQTRMTGRKMKFSDIIGRFFCSHFFGGEGWGDFGYLVHFGDFISIALL